VRLCVRMSARNKIIVALVWFEHSSTIVWSEHLAQSETGWCHSAAIKHTQETPTPCLGEQQQAILFHLHHPTLAVPPKLGLS